MALSPAPDLRRFDTLAKASLSLAKLVRDRATTAVRERGWFNFVLTGGSSPVDLYKTLASPPYREELPWDRIRLLWGDERCVRPDHPDSNYGMARATLISRVPIPAANVLRMVCEDRTPEAAAREYAAALAQVSAPFDLVLLGMGPDGHVASLFPDDPDLQRDRRMVKAVHSAAGSPPVPRVTLTLAAINSAREVVLLISGVVKTGILEQIQADRSAATQRYPAALVAPRGPTTWFVGG